MADLMPNGTMVFIYVLPPKLSDGYCFGGGRPITFLNVDWFNGVDGMTREMLETKVRQKQYVQPGQTYLVLSPDNDLSFTFRGQHKEAGHG